MLELLPQTAEKELLVHIAKNQLVMDGSLPATITAMILGWRRKSSGNSSRFATRKALAHCQAQGLPLGRPKGPASRHKLDAHREEIIG